MGLEGSCVHDDNPSGSIKYHETLEWMNNQWLLKEDSGHEDNQLIIQFLMQCPQSFTKSNVINSYPRMLHVQVAKFVVRVINSYQELRQRELFQVKQLRRHRGGNSYMLQNARMIDIKIQPKLQTNSEQNNGQWSSQQESQSQQ